MPRAGAPHGSNGAGQPSQGIGGAHAAAGPAERDRTNGAGPPGRRAPLRPDDFATLAVLGVVREGCAAFDEVLTAAKALADADWQPTADVLAAAMTRVLDDALLRQGADGFAITDDGEACLKALIEAAPASSRGAAARTAAALKVCFLDVLDPAARQDVLDDLIGLHCRDLDALIDGCGGCPAAGTCPRLWIAREIARMKSEIAWLCDLKQSLPEA